MRKGLGLAEVLIAIGVVAFVGIPILSNVSTAVRETAVTQDYMFAEALAQQHLADAMAVPVEQLDRLPRTRPIRGIRPEDKDRVASLPGYRDLIGRFQGTLVIDEAAEGLLRYTVTLEWSGSQGDRQKQRYVLVRLRCPTDLSCRVRFADPDTTHARTLEGAAQ